MIPVSIQRRNHFSCDPKVLANPNEALTLARTLWARGKREMALDIYDQLAQAHTSLAVKLLSEAFDRMQEIEPKTRYHLYQSRFFDFTIAPGDTVLDIGSGHMPFPLATHLADISLTDGNTGRAGAEFRHVDGKPTYEVHVENTGFADKQFDFVYCSHVLEHADDPAAACRELMRIGKRGYIETPTKGKDALLGSARISNHRWHVELFDNTLVFTEYSQRDLDGFGVGILMDMHTNPKTEREKAFSALVWLRADQCNTMLAWDGIFDFQVHRRSIQAQVPLRIEARESNQTPNHQSSLVDIFPLRLMQVHTFYPSYLDYFYSKNPTLTNAPYTKQMNALHKDGFSAVHMLANHLSPLGYDAHLVVANNPATQHAWAKEHGLSFHDRTPDLPDILRAQIESFRPDVLYLTDPITFDSSFIRKLSYRPRLILGWRAANIPMSWDPSEFDLILSSLKGIRTKALEMGAKDAAHFHPGFPDYLLRAVENIYAHEDVCFCGQINQNQYQRRNSSLQLLAEASAQGCFGLRINLSGDIRAATPITQSKNTGPLFGLDMYRALRSSRIVFDVRGNIGLTGLDGKAVDLAGRETGNMRIFEATGVGAFLLTEHFDNIAEYFEPDREIVTYSNDHDLLNKIDYYLKHEDQRMEIAAKGLERCIKDHSMQVRTRDFDNLVRRKLGLASNRPVPSQEISFSVQDKYLRQATILTQKLLKLASLGLHHRDDIMPLMDSVLRVTAHLIQKKDYRHALKLASAAKLLLTPVLNLDLLRAQAFLGVKEHLCAQEALKEELRFFPNNDEARSLLAHISRWSDEDISCFPIEFRELFDAVRPYTMLSSKRLHSLYDLAKKICTQDVPGNFVECGVAAGGSSALIAFVIKKYSKRPRILYCFDTFCGMPEPTENDTHANTPANETGWGTGTCAAREDSLLEVCTNLDTTDIVRPIKGLFKDTLPQYSKEIADVAFLHMDGDWYESTRDIINNLYDQIASEGLIQVDDYGHWDGCKKALHEFEAKRRLQFDLQKIDATGVWFQKPKSTNKIPNNDIKLLNLGCGYRFHPTWTNVDFKSTGPEVITHDISKGLPFENNSFDGVYHSHLLEHFPKNHAPKFLSECLRVLRPGGIIRIVVPDLETIARLYLLLMEKSLHRDEEAQKRYEWIMLEMFDQMVRNQPGGEMLKYWRKNPIPAETFVTERMGSEISNVIKNIRTQTTNSDMYPECISDAHGIGAFRLSGEIHQWMYDRYSLRKMLQESGFTEIRTCTAQESSIPDFNQYHLDIEPNGTMRKPDSLFMEAIKPRETASDLLEIGKRQIVSNLKIAQFCMQDYGGAGTAAIRLHDGLLNLNIDSTFNVRNIQKWKNKTKIISTHADSAEIGRRFISPEWNDFNDVNHKALREYPNRPKGLEMFSTTWTKTKIGTRVDIANADIIHLHWISGTVNVPRNVKFLKNKKIVWTLHDMNPFTGGCHYSGSCNKYQNHCGRCPQLGSENINDLSYNIWKEKKAAYQLLNIIVASPSQWLAECAKRSALFSSFPVHVIPYGLPTDVFKPYPQKPIRESLKVPYNCFVILFGADSLNNARKGFKYLLQALDVLKNEHKQDNIILAVFGRNNDIATQHLGYQTICFDYVEKDSELAMIYSMADVTVIPSLEDNLPNIVLESLACGTPVVGFNVGGIPDMVDHQVNGYLASIGDAHSLAEGILWTKNQDQNRKKLRLKCRETVLTKYNLLLQAERYETLYKEI